MKINYKQIIAEHERRREALKDHYDPYLGIGSPLERFELSLSKKKKVYLPLPMREEPIVTAIEICGSEGKAAEKLDMELEEFQDVFFKVRIRHDYEFWSATCSKIEDAETNELIPMVLNPSQRISLKDRELMRLAGEPVRQIELKHRQYGSTTEKNNYFFWIQNVVSNGVNAYLCSLDKGGATEILRRYETIIKNYPKEVGKYGLRSYKGMQNTQKVIGSDSIVNIGSAERPNAPSGRTVQCVLISEAGKMKSTAAKGANKLITNMVSMVRLVANTFVLIESTAEEAGAWFRSQVFKAKRGESGFKLTFISWVTDPRCQIHLDESEYQGFIDGMDKYDWEVLWESGASLDQIKWYKKKELEYDHKWEMRQENPTNVEEAFAGAGKKVFNPGMIKNARATVCEPKYIGDIVGRASYGPDSLKDLVFEEDPRGELKIWMLPDDYPTDLPVSHRGAVFVDIGGTTKESDYSVIKVADRWPMLEGGFAECAAVWRGHIDPELLAWKSAQIATFFYKGLLAVEVNALYSRGNNTDGVHYLTIFNEISDHYPNLFTRENPSKVIEKPTQYGYHMTNASKDILVSGLKMAWRDGGGGWVEHSDNAVQEAAFFEIKEDGTMGAIEGEHDDELIATGGVKWLATDYMPAPLYVKPMKKKEKTYNEAMV